MTKLLAYANGSWIPAQELSIAVDDVGFLLGVTITERLRTFGGQVFRLPEHLARMRRSLEIVGLDAAAIVDEFTAAVPQFVAKNAAQIAAGDDWSITAFATPGVSSTGRPTVCVHGGPLQFHQWATAYENGLPAMVSDVRQVPDNCWPSELKCRSRMHYYLAEKRATKRQPGARAILLDQEGYIAESTTANVIIYREHEGLSTPPDDHVLVGISLGVVHELAGQLGIPFMRRRISPDELQTAGEIMLASTSVCLLPVVECDGRPVGDGRPGPTFSRLLSAWGEMVGVDVAAQARKFSKRDKSAS
jgi:branched-subunit amino acid aminotransferase/4-amino-4-deoxychorismate lyase